MIFKKIKIASLTCLALASIATAQDIHFSQLTESPLMVNPANAGFFNGYQRVILNYRDQWTAPNSPFKTMAASVDADLGMKAKKAAYLGLGGFVFQDVAGTANWKTFKGDLFLNGILKTSSATRIALAVGAGYGQNSADLSKLTYGTQYNGSGFSSDLPSYEKPEFQKHNYFDLSAGFNFEYDKTKVNFDADNFYWIKAGIAVYHLNQPPLRYNVSTDSKLAMKYVGSLNARFDIKNTKLSVLPSVVYMMQGKFNQLNAGAYARLRFKEQTKITGYKHEIALWLGCFYRSNDAVIPQLLVEVYGFNVGFAYDYTVSNYKNANKGTGGFEIVLRWVSLRDGLFKRKSELKGGRTGTMGSTPAKT